MSPRQWFVVLNLYIATLFGLVLVVATQVQP